MGGLSGRCSTCARIWEEDDMPRSRVRIKYQVQLSLQGFNLNNTILISNYFKTVGMLPGKKGKMTSRVGIRYFKKIQRVI